ncbi:AB hydrolase superfamily protein C4A8.06c [Cyphellophora attinorum]|uniref:AB hydrolase superfamily protein C4A8.06c n=1 Tax=Cyphellophora attinorum TaxID=1664694 RepID=A0A0N1H9C7_9EURO|nr:AB hydrolase superfamily protein C4A8.06c [Phialophora attinorum]KPI44026.1 AB hydrolase superfamily protein C4A8.06c [Phialophora attinorum]
MDMSPSTAVRLFLQVFPVTVKTALYHLLRLSENVAKQTLRTELLVAIIRTLVAIPTPIGRIQAFGNRDQGIKGGIWISKVTIPAPPGGDLADLVLGAVKDLDESGLGLAETGLPDLKAAAIGAEWTGPRGNVAKDAPRPDFEEREHYENLVKESPGETTILYFHGGGYFTMDPASHRLTTRALAKSTGGRVLSVRYRLAPQHPFPCALLDALQAYLYLIVPPPGAFHEPVKPQHIVFAGDSAGAGLSTSLLLLLLQFQRTASTNATPKLQLDGHSVKVDSSILPAGIALNSPYVDVTHALPSVTANAHYDYLFTPPAPTSTTADTTNLAPPEANFQPPPDEHWPTSPPRADLYAPVARLLAHPLVSPVMSKDEHWKGSPPVWIADDIAVWDKGTIPGLGGMPHCFAMLFPTSPSGKTCMKKWAQFAVDITQPDGHKTGQEAAIISGAYWYKPRQNVAQERYEVPFERLTSISDEEVRRLVSASADRAAKREEEAVRKWERDAAKLACDEAAEMAIWLDYKALQRFGPRYIQPYV